MREKLVFKKPFQLNTQMVNSPMARESRLFIGKSVYI